MIIMDRTMLSLHVSNIQVDVLGSPSVSPSIG